MRGYVYIITDGTSDYKIGFTDNLNRRINQLNSESSSKGNLEYLANAYVGNMVELEKVLHLKYEKVRHKNKHTGKFNEWFRLSEEQLVEVNEFLVIASIGHIFAPLCKKDASELSLDISDRYTKKELTKQERKNIQSEQFKLSKRRKNKKRMENESLNIVYKSHTNVFI